MASEKVVPCGVIRLSEMLLPAIPGPWFAYVVGYSHEISLQSESWIFCRNFLGRLPEGTVLIWAGHAAFSEAGNNRCLCASHGGWSRNLMFT